MEYNTVDIGGLYQLTDDTRLGVMFKNVLGFASKSEYDAFHLPRYLTVGVAAIQAGYTLSFDSEYVFGTFSGLKRKSVEIWFLRAGLEKEISSWMTGRIGCIYPAIAKTSTLGDIRADMPWPKIGGSLGVGLRYKEFSIDLSLYGDPAKSYVKQTPTVAWVASVTLNF